MAISVVKTIAIEKSDRDKLINEINNGKHDKTVVKEIFSLLTKHKIVYKEADLILARAIHLVWKQQDNREVTPLELEEKAK